jgi:hypothetical protein
LVQILGKDDGAVPEFAGLKMPLADMPDEGPDRTTGALGNLGQIERQALLVGHRIEFRCTRHSLLR